MRSFIRKRKQMFIGAFAVAVILHNVDSFAPNPFASGRSTSRFANNPPKMVLSSNDETSSNVDDVNIEDLLNEVTEEMLQDLCTQTGVSTEGTKAEMLTSLRSFAQKQADLDKERKRKQKENIEAGMDQSQGNGKAKHKITTADVLEVDDEEEDVNGVFYYSLPGQIPAAQNKTLAKVTTTTIDKKTNMKNSNFDFGGTITAPPPPPGVKPNEDGEIVVTTYSSTDQNDLTGVAAQQASASGNEQAMAGGYSRTDSIGASLDNPENTLAGGPFGDTSGNRRKKATDQEFDEACGVISELVYSLLSMTGAPGFQEEFSKGVTPFMTEEEAAFQSSAKESSSVKVKFVGFDPSRVPTQLITQASASLRVANGDALRQVLNEVEMQAIGFDGMNGDDKKKGGGHYSEVTKVGTFLEGFRKAEVRRRARETTTMLLDRLMSGGVQDLDQMLMTMTKGDEGTSESGELNDSLVKYLDQAVRDQEKKVELMFGERGTIGHEDEDDFSDSATDGAKDNLAKMWNVTTDEDGNVVESLDPNDPEVKMAIELELREDAKKKQRSAPIDPAKQILNLLILLRERVKAEAAFTNDEKGRNLRLLAYCLHAEDEREREKYIVDNFGNNLDQLDSFSELLMSSIDYAESTSHQLQPAKSGPLNIRLLKNIKDLVDDVKDRQAWKASGITTMEQNRPLPRRKGSKKK